jgi:tetratricopeptide (TPR) repeat protein
LSRLIEIVENRPNEWQVVDQSLTPETQLAIWYRQLSEGYSNLGETALTIDHARKALALLGIPEPVESRPLLISFTKGTVVQLFHRLLPDRYLGKYQNDPVFLERGRALLLLQEAYFFADDILRAFHAGMLSLNYLEMAGMGTNDLAQVLSNFIVGMSALPRDLFLSRYEQLAREALTNTDSLEARALFQFRLGIYYYGVGRWEEGQAEHRDAVEIYHRLGHTRLEVECFTSLANFLYYQGEFTQIDVLGEEVYRLASRQGSIQHMVWGLNLMGAGRLKTAENPNQALNYLESAAELGGDQMPGVTRVLYLGWLADLYLRMEEYDKARKTADAITENLGLGPVFSAMKLQAYTAPALVYLTLWEMAGKEAENEIVKAARSACRALTRYAAIFPIGRPRSALYWGLNHWLSGRTILARNRWRRSLSKAVALDMPYEEALARFEIGRHLPADNRERMEHLETAEEIFERLEARYDLGRCREVREMKTVY